MCNSKARFHHPLPAFSPNRLLTPLIIVAAMSGMSACKPDSPIQFHGRSFSLKTVFSAEPSLVACPNGDTPDYHKPDKNAFQSGHLCCTNAKGYPIEWWFVWGEESDPQLKNKKIRTVRISYVDPDGSLDEIGYYESGEKFSEKSISVARGAFMETERTYYPNGQLYMEQTKDETSGVMKQTIYSPNGKTLAMDTLNYNTNVGTRWHHEKGQKTVDLPKPSSTYWDRYRAKYR